ncbi:MAG: hypothetical protein AAI978_00535 [Candidatus Hodgkinia cicadicola]
MLACANAHTALSTSGGGDSTGALLCSLRLARSNISISLDHSLRYESARELFVKRLFVCEFGCAGANAHLRLQRVALLTNLARRLAKETLTSAHTLTDNTEHVLARANTCCAFSLAIPYSIDSFGIKTSKPWLTLLPRRSAYIRYVNDISNTDASLFRTLQRQLSERTHKRVYWSKFARTRLALTPC